jgi:putative membrane protein
MIRRTFRRRLTPQTSTFRARSIRASCLVGVFACIAVPACGDDDDTTSTGSAGTANTSGTTPVPGAPGSGTSGGAGGTTGNTGTTTGTAGAGAASASTGASATGAGAGTSTGAGTMTGTGNTGAGTSSNTGLAGSGGASAGMGGSANAGTAGSSTIIADFDGGVVPDAGLAAVVRDLSDDEMVLVVDTINAGEVEQAQAALPRLSNQEVRAFAQEMIDEHTAARAQLDQLAVEENLTLAASDVAQSLRDEGAAIVAELLATEESAIDAQYVNSQVLAHSQALQVLAGLIAGADNDALRAQLTELRGNVSAHLDRARELQGVVGS